jgi:hypothetical protein
MLLPGHELLVKFQDELIRGRGALRRLIAAPRLRIVIRGEFAEVFTDAKAFGDFIARFRDSAVGC